MEDVKSMRGRSLLFVLLVGLLGPSLSFADLVAEDSEDNKWAVFTSPKTQFMQQSMVRLHTVMNFMSV